MVVAVVLLGLTSGCTGSRSTEEGSTVPSKSIQQVLTEHTDSLMALPGVVGTAIGRCDTVLCIRVFLRDSSAAARRAIPDTLEGYPVQVEVTGEFRKRGGGGASSTPS
jgi:hypothetical protein